MKALLRLALIAVIAALLHPVSAAPSLPKYTAAEAPKHIGEKATVVGKVGCIDAGRTYHMLSLDGCTPTSPFWIIVNDDASGPDLNVHDLKGVTIAVTGKIERPQTQPWMIVKSTTQIQTRSPVNTDYISHAHEKEAQSDLDNAIELFNQAIEHQPDRRNEAYEFIARIKERKGDWNGALASYDAMVAVDPNKDNSYYIRATAKKQHGDFEGAMADFTRAAELRSSGAGYLEVASLRKDHGDLAGAMATYDKGIEVLNAQIARAPEALLYYQRGYANELKGDVDAAVADYTRAIEMHPSYMACAYSRRGDIRKARGDRAGAIADYEHAVKYAQLDEDKEKLNHARTEVEREQAPLADSKSVYGDDKATASLSRTAHPQAASKQHANSDTADDAESPTALVTRAKLRIRTGDFDGAIEDCDRALRLSRGGSKEAYDLRIQAMKAKANPRTKSAQPVQQVSSPQPPVALTISVTETSIKIGDIELRKGPPQGKYRYISPAAAEKALGPVTEIHLQEGIRGAEKGKIFKLQVYMEDDYDARSEKNSGKFNGHVQVEGVDIGPGTTFDSVRDELKKEGYKITEQPDLSYAQKSGPWGQIQIFTAGGSGKIGRVEVWCL